MDYAIEPWDLHIYSNRKKPIENLTPHKIAVVTFIREFGVLRSEGKDIIDYYVSANYRKDFCILALKLIQCPDMEFKEFETLITNGKYHLLTLHLQNFCARLQHIYANGIGALTDCVTSTEKLMIDQSETSPSVISRSSILGLYLRRTMLHLDKLTFSQLSSLYKTFCVYYQKGRPGLMMRSLSKEVNVTMSQKLNNSEQMPVTTQSISTNVTDDPKHEHSMKFGTLDKENNYEEHMWSLRQAELFVSQQANLLQLNEKRALPPNQLQKIIVQIVHDIPEYPEVHFLGFLNCLRIKELCGAQEALYNYFDRTLVAGQTLNHICTERNKTFRFAALKRAAMHAIFGHNELAMESVRESLVMAQEATDGACLSHVVGWAARVGGRARRAALLARTPRSPRAAPAAAAAAQFLAQHIAVNGAIPSDVYALITKGESINYLHSMIDFTMASLANIAALWSMYGKVEMSSVTAQLLLNLNTKASVTGACVAQDRGEWQWTEATAAVAAGAAIVCGRRGHVALAAHIAAYNPSPPVVAAARFAAAKQALYAGRWEEAENSIEQLASIERWDSQLLKAEMFFLKGEATEALEALRDVLDYCKTEDDSLNYVSLKINAVLLMSQVRHTFCGINSTNSSNIMLLNDAVASAIKYSLHFLAATTEMHIGNIQLHMGCLQNAFSIVKKALPIVMAHGGCYDLARAMLLYSKCRVALAPRAGEARIEMLQSCCDALDTVKKNFSKVEAHSRVMEIWYLQAQLYNEIGNHAARNQCACIYRQLETQYNIEPTNMFIIAY